LDGGAPPPLEFPGHWLYVEGVPCIHVADRAAYNAHSERLGIPASPEAVDHVAFNGNDYEEAIARLGREGVAARTNVVPGAGLRQLFIEDPNGLKIEINVMSREE
jgi:catechol 2,3-dioxygenase-like lactoylglutathione lyase family enzyme